MRLELLGLQRDKDRRKVPWLKAMDSSCSVQFWPPMAGPFGPHHRLQFHVSVPVCNQHVRYRLRATTRTLNLSTEWDGLHVI